MSKRRLRNAGYRPKAFLGIGESAAILAAAGINVAGTMAASALNASATKKAAQDQANAAIRSAQEQSQAIKDQTEKSREYQLQSQEFIKQQNDENRDLQKDIQMQLQMLTGQQNVNDRLEASKIRVKNGGKLKRLGNQQSLLRGGNMPFVVTDGGGVIPIGVTPEGFDLYEIVGNDHEHYHKSRGGKYKSGVGIKFANGGTVEGEGNQNSRTGELMLVTPDDAYFISDHKINGNTPADLVRAGMHPLQAYAIQEQSKNILGINDDGSKRAKLGKRKFLAGGMPTLYDYYNQIGPKSGVDTLGDTSVAIASNDKRLLKCGGHIRRKAPSGTNVPVWNWNTKNWVGASYPANEVPSNAPWNYYLNEPNHVARGSAVPVTPIPSDVLKPSPASIRNTNNTSNTTRGGFSNWVDRNADLLGAGINAIGNFGGAWITSSANRSAARTLADAYNRGADIMAEAYRNLQTIDTNSLRREDYRAAHMMPALQAPVSFAATNIAGSNRSLQRRLSNAGRYSMSSAAAQERMSNAEVEAQDERNRIYNEDQQQMQQIRQANAERVTEAAKTNAMLDTEANKQFGQDYLNLLKYNNDIVNERILGSAGALSEGDINAAGALAQGRTSSSQAWANALANSGLTFSNTLSSMAKRRADLENTMLGATTSAQVNYISRNGSRYEKDRMRAAFESAIRSNKLSNDDRAMYEYYIKLLS